MKLKTRTMVLLIIAMRFLGLAGCSSLAVYTGKDRAHEAGMPTTIEDIIPPHVPDTDNAAPVIARFAPLLRVIQLPTCKELSSTAHLIGVLVDGQTIGTILYDQNERRELRYDHSVDPDQKADAVRLAAERKEEKTVRAWITAQLDSSPALAALAVIQEAAAKPGYAPDLRGSMPPWSDVPRWSDDGYQIAEGAILLSGYALLAADRGQTEDACADVWAMLQLADFLANEPVLSRQYSRLCIWRMAIDNLEELAAAGKLPPAWNRKFAGRLAAMNPAGDLARDVSAAGIMGGDVYFEGILYGKISYNDISPSTSWGMPDNLDDQFRYGLLRYGYHGKVREEYAIYIDWHRQVSAAIAEPGISLMVLDQRLQDAATGITPDRKILSVLLQDTREMIYPKMGTRPSNEPLSVGWGPSNEWAPMQIGKMIVATWSIRTKIAVAQVGLALERYRAEKGVYPPTLAALAPEYLSAVPAEAEDDKPLHYDRVPGGAIINKGLMDRSGDNPVWLAGKATE